ncbi:MAG: hypothetical protein R3F50_20335 [Gammaproteobacteria bacterium]
MPISIFHDWFSNKIISEKTPLHASIIRIQDWVSSPKCSFTIDRITSFPTNPLVTPKSSLTLGKNINGPSLIKVPDWVEDKLGRYYLYFAHHKGKHIRMAYSDMLEGPWKVYEPGVLHLTDTPGFNDHLASPDVHVLEDERRIRMYFHGARPTIDRQETGIAHSHNGLQFSGEDRSVGKFYFRVWNYKGVHFALAKNYRSGWSQLYTSLDGGISFKPGRKLLRRARHTAVMVIDDNLLIFFSRVGDCPERILLTSIDMRKAIDSWQPSRPIEVLRPNDANEGIDCPMQPSLHGAQTNVCQLRDPCVFSDSGRIFLFYSIRGEVGISGVELRLHKQN